MFFLPVKISCQIDYYIEIAIIIAPLLMNADDVTLINSLQITRYNYASFYN